MSTALPDGIGIHSIVQVIRGRGICAIGQVLALKPLTLLTVTSDGKRHKWWPESDVQLAVVGRARVSLVPKATAMPVAPPEPELKTEPVPAAPLFPPEFTPRPAVPTGRQAEISNPPIAPKRRVGRPTIAERLAREAAQTVSETSTPSPAPIPIMGPVFVSAAESSE